MFLFCEYNWYMYTYLAFCNYIVYRMSTIITTLKCGIDHANDCGETQIKY